MKCELCGKPIEEGARALPIGFVSRGYVETFTHGIHQECIKEMLDVLRSATLVMKSSIEREAYKTGESNGI